MPMGSELNRSRMGIHYSSGGAEYAALLLHFAGPPEKVQEVLGNNYGYISKKEALGLADGLERLYSRLRKDDVRPLLGRWTARRKLARLVPAIDRELGLPAPPGWLAKAMARMMSDQYWDWEYDFPHLILLCRKGGGFWWC